MNPAAKRQRTDDADGVGTNTHAFAQHQHVPYGSSGISGQTYQTHLPRYGELPIPGGPAMSANTYYHPPHQYIPIYMPPPRPSQMYYPNPIPDGITVPRIEELVSAIDSDSLERILLQLAQQDTSGLVQSTLVSHYVQQALEEQSEIIDFGHLSKRAWHAINAQYAGMSGSKQYDRSWDVTRDVVECIESIRGQVKEFSSFETKVNALETLRKIAKTILLSGDVIGHEVRQHFQCESAFSEAVAEILDSMSEYECVAAGQNVSEVGKGTLLEKLEWLCAEAENHCLEDLDVSEACARLRDEGSGGYTADEGEEEEEEDITEEFEEEEEELVEEDEERDDFPGADRPPLVRFFEACVDEVQHLIQSRYSYMSASEQSARSSAAATEVEAAIARIREHADGASSHVVRRGALDALYQIAIMILGSKGNVLATEIRKHFQNDDTIPELMLSIVRSTSEHDRKALDEDRMLTINLAALFVEAKAHAITVYDRLDQAIVILSRASWPGNLAGVVSSAP